MCIHGRVTLDTTAAAVVTALVAATRCHRNGCQHFVFDLLHVLSSIGLKAFMSFTLWLTTTAITPESSLVEPLHFWQRHAGAMRIERAHRLLLIGHRERGHAIGRTGRHVRCSCGVLRRKGQARRQAAGRAEHDLMEIAGD